MKHPQNPLHLIATLLLACAALCGTAAHAQASIDQNKVLAGNVTPGDAPGFPLTLSQPGSYKLTSNLHVPAGSGGVLITTANVTLDLNGFTIQGPTTCTRQAQTRAVTCQTVDNGVAGVVVAGDGARIRSGTVKGFSFAAVHSNGRASRLEDLRLTESGLGVFAQAQGAAIQRVVADTNATVGIWAPSGIVAHCSALNNGGRGFWGSTVTLLSESQATGNLTGVEGMVLRGVVLGDNAVNQLSTHSLGGNLDGLTTF